MTPLMTDEARRAAVEAGRERAIGHAELTLRQLIPSIAEAAIETYEARLAELGYVMVPKEATEAMISAASVTGRLDAEDSFGDERGAREVWSAMLAAAEEK